MAVQVVERDNDAAYVRREGHLTSLRQQLA